VNENETRMAEHLASDLERVLGTGIVVEDVEVRGEDPVTVHVTCLVDGAAREIRGAGDTAAEAMAAVVRQAADLRIEGAFWQLVGPA
jgi:hypothetical protein